MTEKIEPMTAAEYRRSNGFLTERGNRILAALEEREALLEQAKFGSADASVGALVRRIREHPVIGERGIVTQDFWGNTVASGLTDEAFHAILSHLDSLLPKEPEWSEFAPSNRQYRLDGDALFMRWGDKPGERVWREYAVPLSDVPVVAALMAKGGKDD